MKFLSIVIFTVLMAWTWFVINSEPAISLETHAGIQSKLATLISDSIKAKKPQSSDFAIENIWTEPVSSDDKKQVRAHFAYRYLEPTEAGGQTTSSISGEALLEEQPDDGSGFEKWALKHVQTSSDSMTFSEPLVITTGDSDDKTPVEPKTE